jgi:hypothetical protein
MKDALPIEQQVVQTYQENIQFFKETQPILYRKLQAYESAVDQGLYKERYELEYKEKSYFDVKENATGNYLYGKNSTEYAEDVSQSINFKKEDNLFETYYNTNVKDSSIENIEQQTDLIRYGHATVVSLINYSQKNASKTTTTMKKLYKFIFLGVGLGTHITSTHKKINSNIYLIVEDDLELFRLSLFVTNYKEITQTNGATLYFSVFDDEVTFIQTIQRFLKDQFVYNHYIKFFHMLNHSDKKLKNIQSIIITSPHISFKYSALMISLLRPLEYIQNGYKIFSLNGVREDASFSKFPMLLIGAGPSFEKSIEWIKENHSKFTVVIVSALMSKFEEIGVKPDIITHTHGFPDAMPHIEKVKDMSFFKDSIELFGAMSYPEFTVEFKKENVYIFEGTSNYKGKFGSLSASNIGAMSYGLLLYLKASSIYLIGLDFALDQKTGKTHSRTHSHTKDVEIELHDVGGAINPRTEVLEVEGNFHDKVYTTPLFNAMKTQCNALSQSYKEKNQKVFNLSKDGAKIKNTEALLLESDSIKTLPSIDKKELFHSLKASLDRHSENFLTEQEIEDLQSRIDYCDTLIDRLNQHLQTPHHNDINQYHYNLLGTFYDILTEKTDPITVDVNTLLTLYLELASGYIFDLINTKEILDEKELIKQLNKITIPQIIRVVEFFKKELERFLEILGSK